MRVSKETVRGSLILSQIDVCFFLGLNVFLLLGVPPFLRFFLKIYILGDLSQLGGFFVILVLRRILFVYLYLMFFFYSLMRLRGKELSLIVLKFMKSGLYLILFNLRLRMMLLRIYYLNNRKLKKLV